MDCSECIFIERIASSGGPLGGPQCGCHADRIKHLAKKDKSEYKNGVYHLDRFCNMYRQEDWKSKDETLQESLQRAKDEIEIIFGVLIEDDPSKPMEDIEQAVKSVIQSDYPKDKILLLISTGEYRNISEMVHLVNVTQEEIEGTELIIHKYSGMQQMREKECFEKLFLSHYFVKMLPHSRVSQNFFSSINNSLNTEMEKITMYENDCGVKAINKSIARSLYLEYGNYDKMCFAVKELSSKEGMYKLLK